MSGWAGGVFLISKIRGLSRSTSCMSSFVLRCGLLVLQVFYSNEKSDGYVAKLFPVDHVVKLCIMHKRQPGVLG